MAAGYGDIKIKADIHFAGERCSGHQQDRTLKTVESDFTGNGKEITAA
jgi:hypothetical protein